VPSDDPSVPSAVLAEGRVCALLRTLSGRLSCVSCLAIDAQLPRDTVLATADRLSRGGSYRVSEGICVLCRARTTVLHFAVWHAEPHVEFGRGERVA